MEFDKSNYRITDASKIINGARAIGIGGLALSLIGLFVDSHQFYFSYLTAFIYWLSLGLGGLFLTLLSYLVGARWSVVLRRLHESVMAALPYMAIFFVPVVIGLHSLYHWSHPEAVATDHLLQHKSGFLNDSFFVLRAIIYFSIWTVLARRIYRLSLSQDVKDSPELKTKLIRTCAPGMILFALSLTFAAFDWIMSLDPHWFSTIFGVYYFAGTFLCILAFTILMALFLRKQNILAEEITVEHYHDLGKLLFGFTVFWAYIAFSQYFLIWYANIPEETIWYLHRWEGSWKYVSIALVLAHFVLPFLILINRDAKRNLSLLKVMAIWYMVIHWIDIYWLIAPTHHHHGAHFSWMDLSLTAGIGGMFIWIILKRFTANAIIPINDPNLEESKHFVNQ